MSYTPETRSDIIELVVAMLNKAPSLALMNELAFAAISGSTIKEIAALIAATDEYKAQFPISQTAEEWSNEALTQLMQGGTVTDEIRKIIVDTMVGFINGGSSRSDVTVMAVEYLASTASLANVDLKDIGQAFQNRSAAAVDYTVTITIEGTSSTEAELAAVLEGVTSDADTLTAAKAAFAAGNKSIAAQAAAEKKAAEEKAAADKAAEEKAAADKAAADKAAEEKAAADLAAQTPADKVAALATALETATKNDTDAKAALETATKAFDAAIAGGDPATVVTANGNKLIAQDKADKAAAALVEATTAVKENDAAAEKVLTDAVATAKTAAETAVTDSATANTAAADAIAAITDNATAAAALVKANAAGTAATAATEAVATYVAAAAKTADKGDDTAAETLSTTAATQATAATDSVTEATAEAAIDRTPQVFALTTGLDTGSSFTGGTGDDTFTANATATATPATNTFTTGDSVSGGAGTDTLVVAISDGATTPSALVATSGIEKLSIFNNDSGGFVLQGDLMDGLTDIYVTSGQDAITVDQLNSKPNLHLIATNVNATLTATTATVAGTADAITIAANGVATTASVDATFQGIETVNLVGAGADTGSAGTNLEILSTSLETVNVTGTTDMVLVVNLDGADNAGEVATFNASAATGNITATLTAGGSTELAVTMGSGDDVITLGDMDKDYTVDGGEGTDRIVTSAAGYNATLLAAGTLTGQNVTNVEVLGLTAGGSADLRAFTNNTFASLFAQGTATFTGLPATAASLTTIATGSLTLDRATDGAADSAAVTLYPVTPGTFTLVNVADEETVTLTSSGIAAGSNTITTLTATDTTSLTIAGDRDLTITNAIAGTALATLNASGLVGQGVALDINASNSLVAMTVTAGAGSEAATGDTMNTIQTGSGADTVTGGDYKDIITTGAGADSVTAGGGDDTITTSFGNDYVDGGAGDDTITDSVGNDTLIGGAGNDTIDGAAGADSIDGGAGNDKIYLTTLGSNDTIDGGVGTDQLSANAVAAAVVTADFVDLTESSALNITGVEAAYIEVNAASTDTITSPLNVDFTAVTGLTTLNLDVNVIDDEAMKLTNFGGSSIVMTGLAGTEDPEFVNIDGAEQAALGLTVRGFAPATAAQADVTFTGISAVTVTGDSYLSTSAQTNRLGSITADSADSLTIASDGVGSYGSNGNALLITNAVSAANAQTLTINVGRGDTMDIGTANGATDDVTAANSIVQTLNVTTGENATLTVGGTDITLGSAVVNTVTVTNGIGGTINALNINAGSAATTTVTLGASSAATLDLNYTITAGTVTMSTGSSWTVATLGAAATASAITISGYGDVVEGTSIGLVGSTFNFDAGNLTDPDGLTVTAANLTGAATITGSNTGDTITGGGSADTITGGLGTDDIYASAGADRIVLTETVSSEDEVYYSATTPALQIAAAGDTIVGFTSGTDIIVFELDAYKDPAGATPDTGAATQMVTNMATNADISGNTVAFIYQLDGTTDSTVADTAAGAAAALASVNGADAPTLANIIFALDDGTDSYLWMWNADGGASADVTVDADELTLIGTVTGITAFAAGDIVGE